ncbi:restriction endonuclease subunit S [Acidimicrobiales bacterium]|nr:restriction endonuclease subunit S [Acidimicrobiales bacterium]
MKSTIDLPDGWRQATLGELCDVIADGTHYTPAYVDRGIPFYSVENITRDDFVNVKYISPAEHRRLVKRCRPMRGDILMTRIGSLGKTKLLDWDVDASIYVSLALLRPSLQVDGQYLYAFTKSQDFVKSVEDRSLLWAAPKKINMGDIEHVDVLVPSSSAEQKAIADAVIASEGHVAALDRMIAKKEAIKQGMMQELLTGRTRLPGFTAPWQEILLGEHVSYVKTVALSRAQLNRESDIRYLHYGDIHTRSDLRLDAEHEAMPRADRDSIRNAGRLQIGDLVFADASEDADGVGKSIEIASVPEAGVVAGLHTIAARFDKRVLADGFKAYLQYIPDFRASLLRLAAGTKVLATTRTHVSSISLQLPGAPEQRAIASCLSDAETEIQALRRRLTKASDTKQGMMQELLTGRTRLPVKESAA